MPSTLFNWFSTTRKVLGTLFFSLILLVTSSAFCETYDAVGLESPEPTPAYNPDAEMKEWLWAGVAGTATIFLVSQTKNGPLIFGGIYAASTLFLMRETFYRHDDDPVDLVLPFGMLAMSVLNFALLNNDAKYTYGDIFTYNIVGAGLLTAYAWWDNTNRLRSGHRRAFSILPTINDNQAGLAWYLRY